MVWGREILGIEKFLGDYFGVLELGYRGFGFGC